MNAITADRPLGEGDLDRLGFGLLAERVARALVGQTSPAGLVVGIEGAWGSGKSSLVFLTLKALRELEARPEVIEFRPWLVGDREALLGALFAELGKAVAAIELEAGDASETTALALKGAAGKLQTFALRLEAPGKAAELLKDIVPGAGAVAAILQGAADVAKAGAAAPSLSRMKDDLSKSLRALPRRIVVMIDDVDRLEPGEAIELLRLVRSVADFPNVVYVLCYDQPVLARSVEVAARISNGAAYLEKIIQVTVPVPIPESFDLRQWFARDLAAIAETSSVDEQKRVSEVIDIEGGRRLETPRAVVRALNCMAFAWPALRNDVDLADLVWLQLIRAQSTELYRWIEEYCAGAAVRQLGRGSVSSETRLAMLNRLQEIFAAEKRELSIEAAWQLSEHLPGLTTDFTPGASPLTLYERMPDDELASAIRTRRLSSPDHYRLYFALSQPDTAPRQADYEELFSACDGAGADLPRLFQSWARQTFASGGTRLDLMLERLRGDSRQIDGARAAAIVRAFADGYDAMLQLPDGEHWSPVGWRAAERLMPVMAPRIRSHDAGALVASFRDGSAVRWLSNLLRDELAARDRLGQGRQGQPFLEDDELAAVEQVMRARYRSLGLSKLFDAPRPGMIIFIWRVIDDAYVRKQFARLAQTDAGLLHGLNALAGRVRTTGATSKPQEFATLKEEIVSTLVDYERTRERVNVLARGDGPLAAEAQVVLGLFEAGDHF